MINRFNNPRRVQGRSILTLLIVIAVMFGLYSIGNKDQVPADGQKQKIQAAVAKPHMVVIYTNDDCEPCDRAKTWFRQRGVKFEERNVGRRTAYERELEKLGSRIVPVIVVDGQAQYGFMPAYLEDLLK